MSRQPMFSKREKKNRYGNKPGNIISIKDTVLTDLVLYNPCSYDIINGLSSSSFWGTAATNE